MKSDAGKLLIIFNSVLGYGGEGRGGEGGEAKRFTYDKLQTVSMG